MTLASDLRWLISEGYVIEFNDGSLDLPRTKPPVVAAKTEAESAAASLVTPETPAAAPAENVADNPLAPVEEASLLTVERTVEDLPADEPPAQPKEV